MSKLSEEDLKEIEELNSKIKDLDSEFDKYKLEEAEIISSEKTLSEDKRKRLDEINAQFKAISDQTGEYKIQISSIKRKIEPKGDKAAELKKQEQNEKKLAALQKKYRAVEEKKEILENKTAEYTSSSVSESKKENYKNKMNKKCLLLKKKLDRLSSQMGKYLDL